MKILERNKSAFWYALYGGKQDVTDENGFFTGEKPVYEKARMMRASISSAAGTAQMEQFGTLTDYDRVIITDETGCKIDENTVLFIDKEPEYAEDGAPLYDYVVKRVARSRNFISYAVSKVSVS